MGSSGMKKKGRQHLPKAGTATDQAWVRREGVRHMEHPFADDPSAKGGAWAHVIAVIVAGVLILAMVGWLFLSA